MVARLHYLPLALLARIGGEDEDYARSELYALFLSWMAALPTPILNPPETGILGVGRVVEKPGVFECQVCVRKMMTLSLTFNHMVTDGGPAMSFLRTLADMLEQPVRMLG